eukprot:4786287-Prymnesium_polylepis.1
MGAKYGERSLACGRASGREPSWSWRPDRNRCLPACRPAAFALAYAADGTCVPSTVACACGGK